MEELDNLSGDIIPTQYFQFEINARDTIGLPEMFSRNCVAKDVINILSET